MSSSIVEQLTSQLSGPALEALSGQLGVDNNTTASAVQAALPMLIGALDKNTNSTEGAASLQQALQKDHDGSILDNLTGFLGSSDNGSGAAILGHILGGKQSGVEQGVSKMSGMNPQLVSILLQNLAPIVMGQLGKTQRERGLDPSDLSSMLGQEREVARQTGGSTGSMAVDLITKMMDQDGDGSMLDDLGGMLGGFLR